MKANEVRKAFTDFFVERDHRHLPSASLIPHDPTLLFTVAGMVPLKTFFTGEEQPPHPRAVTVQKCVRAGGKHNDLDEIGRTSRHLTFFEMMGNFSFGDYFKSEAIAWAWEFLTDVLGLDPERLWVTVHLSDDEATGIWHHEVGVPVEPSVLAVVPITPPSFDPVLGAVSAGRQATSMAWVPGASSGKRGCARRNRRQQPA